MSERVDRLEDLVEQLAEREAALLQVVEGLTRELVRQRRADEERRRKRTQAARDTAKRRRSATVTAAPPSDLAQARAKRALRKAGLK